MDSIKQWWIEERSKKAIEKLKANEFKAIYVETREGAVQEIWKYITPKLRIGVGGSLTIRELGILEKLEEQGNAVYNHWKPGLSKENVLEIRKFQMTSDLFLSSVNAITLNGELVNIDGIGNRVNSINFGPGKVILVVGYNKIVDDVQEAIHRIKNFAAPLNARRLNIDVPCAKVGKCVDCNSPNRICRVIVIHERKPSLTDILIILVGEEMGF
ncbi:MAG: lactate utilization protein C [Deltaproteobacteria bacterium RBG_19FT_COMBO_46_12]|nr:MAG: lactate utilization protein C [Deltaproteobacteria bacterium RBG_19FT_COMBO_46_12]